MKVQKFFDLGGKIDHHPARSYKICDAVCADCPFNTDAKDYPGRKEKRASVLAALAAHPDATWFCHETTHPFDGEVLNDSKICLGFLQWKLK